MTIAKQIDEARECRFVTAPGERRVVDFYRSLDSAFFGAVVSTRGVDAGTSDSRCEPGPYLTFVTLLGELDLATAPLVRECFARIGGNIEVDCSGLEFVDAQGLGVFASTQARMDANFVFVDPTCSLLRLLRITGLDASLEVRSNGLMVR
jgi:anti-anti-sigma factor